MIDLGSGFLQICANQKGDSKANCTDSLHAKGIQSLENKKSKQDLHMKIAQTKWIRLDRITSPANYLVVLFPVYNNNHAFSMSRPQLNTPSAVPLKITEAQIPYADHRIFDLAKPILTIMVYHNITWPVITTIMITLSALAYNHDTKHISKVRLISLVLWNSLLIQHKWV